MAGKRKKKNAITLAAMMVILVLLIVGYVMVSKSQEEKEQKEAEEAAKDTSVQLLAAESEQIILIGVDSDAYDYTLKRAEQGWVLAGDEEFPLDTTVPDTMLGLLENFSATRLVLENAPDLNEYGLTEDAFTISLKLADGTDRVIRIGDKSTADGGYYTCMDDGADVYLVEETNRMTFALEEADLLLLDMIPTFSAAYVTGLKVDSDTWKEFTIADVPENEVDLTARNVYTSSLYGVYEEPVHIDSTSFAELMENYTTLAFGELVSYEEAALAAAGLDAPKHALTIDYKDSTTSEPGEFTLYIGTQDADGENYYVRLEGSNQVFLMDKESVETMMTPDIFYAVSKYTQMVNITIVGEVAVAYEATDSETAVTRSFGLTHETTLENGAQEITDFFTVDGKELTTEEEADAFRDLYQTLIGIKLSGELSDNAALADTSILDITFKADETLDVLRTVRYIPLAEDNTLCAIEVDGKALFTVERTSVEEVIYMLEEYRS